MDKKPVSLALSETTSNGMLRDYVRVAMPLARRSSKP
jgi:hypothetical protein